MMENDTERSRSTEILTEIEAIRAENTTGATGQTTAQGAATAAPVGPAGERLSRYVGERAESCPDCGHSQADLWISEGATEARLRCRACQTTFEEESR